MLARPVTVLVGDETTRPGTHARRMDRRCRHVDAAQQTVAEVKGEGQLGDAIQAGTTHCARVTSQLRLTSSVRRSSSPPRGERRGTSTGFRLGRFRGRSWGPGGRPPKAKVADVDMTDPRARAHTHHEEQESVPPPALARAPSSPRSTIAASAGSRCEAIRRTVASSRSAPPKVHGPGRESVHPVSCPNCAAVVRRLGDVCGSVGFRFDAPDSVAVWEEQHWDVVARHDRQYFGHGRPRGHRVPRRGGVPTHPVARRPHTHRAPQQRPRTSSPRSTCPVPWRMSGSRTAARRSSCARPPATGPSPTRGPTTGPT